MSVTLNKDQQLAIEHFERKLAYEVGPVEVARGLEARQPYQIIDLRTPEYFGQGHVPTAVNVSFEELEGYASKLDINVPVVVYCYNIVCHLSTKAALALARKGFKVRELVGGFEEWNKLSLNVEKGEKKQGSSRCSCG